MERLRTTEMLPKQYRTGIYDNSKQNVKQFVLILNDLEESSYGASKEKLATQFADNIIFEVKMSASNSSLPPSQDIWENYLDIDLRAFDKSPERIDVMGRLFT